MVRCPECGTENPERAKFCKGCGAELAPSTEKEESSSISLTERKKVDEEEKKEEVTEAVFYAQPHDLPNIKWDEFKKGTVKKTRLSRHMVTDITIHVLNTAKSIDTVKLSSVKGDALHRPQDGENPLDIVIIGKSLELHLREKKYKGLSKSNAENFYVSIRVKGGKEKISEFINTLTERADYSPWDMDDWAEFTSETEASRDEVIKSWKKYQRKISAPRSEFKYCPECGEEVKEWRSFCPKCEHEFGKEGKEEKAEKYNKYSKIVGIASIAIIVLGVLIAPIAIYLGYKARKKDSSKGKWGMGLGGVGLLLWIVVIASVAIIM